MSEHTPTPWGMWSEEGQTEGGRCRHSICANNSDPDEKGDLDVGAMEDRHCCVAQSFGETEDNARANAAFIVQAANAHDDLIEALYRLKTECDLEGLRNRAGFDCWLGLADKALAKASLQQAEPR